MKRLSVIASLCPLMIGFVGAGCASPIPRYPSANPQETIQSTRDNFAAVTSISGPCTITLISEQGDSITLDAAIAAKPPDHLRLRAWKFGHAVFDATVVGGEVWLVPFAGPQHGPATMPEPPTGYLSRAMNLLGPAYFDSARAVSEQVRTITVVGPGPDDAPLACDIDRATRLPISFHSAEQAQTADHAPASRSDSSSSFTLGNYQAFGDVVWPTRMRFSRGRSSVTIRMEDITLNEPIADAALTPPPRAVKQPPV